MEEIWKDIVGYNGIYMVSNFGNVKSLYKTGRTFDKGDYTIKQRPHNGYMILNLHKDGVQKTISVHRLVAMAFIDNPDKCKCVNHIDYNKANNNVSNLEWVTHRENNKHFSKSKEYTSKYFGVCWDKGASKWYAGITNKGKQRFIGLFEREYDAHLAYEKALSNLLSSV